MPLTSLDLFSGIGGMALALRGIATPCMYCDISPAARQVLEKNMRKGRLPRAPIHTDIRNISNQVLTEYGIKKVDVITAGFPCTGFSKVGKQQGFSDEGSALFFELLRVCRLAQPTVVFMENSPMILSMGLDRVHKAFARMGYALRWCVYSAAAVGAPHMRKRWFCTAIKSRNATITVRVKDNYLPHRWIQAAEPDRMTLSSTADFGTRHSLLGNALVPDTARVAFIHLCSAGDDTIDQSVHRILQTRVFHIKAPLHASDAVRHVHKTIYPAHGVAVAHAVYKWTCDVTAKPPRSWNLILDPALFTPRQPPAADLTRELVSAPIQKDLWGTPTSGVGTNNYLTERNHTMFHAQVRFEKGTSNRNGRVAPEFAEWIMGFPRGWTMT